MLWPVLTRLVSLNCAARARDLSNDDDDDDDATSARCVGRMLCADSTAVMAGQLDGLPKFEGESADKADDWLT